MSVRVQRRSDADGLSENVLKAILEQKRVLDDKAAAEQEKVERREKEEKTSHDVVQLEQQHERRTGGVGGGGGSSFLDTTSLSTSSKRSLHSSRLTLSDTKEFFRTVGCRWIRAVRLGDATTVKKMLEEKPELVHYAPMYGPLALHVATARSDRSIILLLAAKGADLDARDSAGYTSLQLAIRRSDQSLAHFLISQGANQELCDPDGLHINDYETWTQRDQEAAENFGNGKSLLRPKAHSFVGGSPSSMSVKSSQSHRQIRPSSTPDTTICSANGEKAELKREGTRSSWKSFFEKNPITKKFGSSSKI